MEKIVRLIALLGICTAIYIPCADAAYSGTAKGFLRINEDKVSLSYSYAVKKGKKVRVILSDRPVPADALEKYKRLVEMGAGGELSAIEVVIGSGKNVDEVFFYDSRLPAEISVKKPGPVTRKRLKDQVLSGEVLMNDPGFSFGYKASFSVPVSPAAEKEIVEAEPGASVVDQAKVALRNRDLDFDEETFRRKVMDGDAAAVKLFLEAGMPPEINGWPAIATAVEWDRANVAQVLIDAGSDVNVRDEAGQSLVLQAGSRGRLPLLEVLIRAGADVNIPNNYGATPLSAAAGQGKLSIVQALVKAGANVNARSTSGGTALQAAVVGGHTKIVRLLIASGADVARDRKELVAIARKGKYPDVERLIRNAPARHD